jgi:hypothetical protein
MTTLINNESEARVNGDNNLSSLLTNLKTTVDNHIANLENPHKVIAE